MDIEEEDGAGGGIGSKEPRERQDGTWDRAWDKEGKEEPEALGAFYISLIICLF